MAMPDIKTDAVPGEVGGGANDATVSTVPLAPTEAAKALGVDLSSLTDADLDRATAMILELRRSAAARWADGEPARLAEKVEKLRVQLADAEASLAESIARHAN